LDTQFDAEIRTAGLRFGISELVEAPGSHDREIATFVQVLDDARSAENSAVTSEKLMGLTGQADQLIQKFERIIAKVQQIEARATSEALGITGVLGQKELAANILRRNSWFSGSFYLSCFVIIVVLISVAQRFVDAWSFPLILAAGIVTTAVIGALQLRNDDRLSEARLSSAHAAIVKPHFHLLPSSTEQEGNPSIIDRKQ
jgi:hypothetical protein